MKYLTFITGLPGAKTHTVLRSLYSDDTLIYKENDDPKKEEFWKAYPNHVTYMTEDNIRMPKLFDRSNRLRVKMGLNHKEYYELVDNQLDGIYSKYGKQILITCHTPTNVIRKRYPASTIYYIDVDDNNVGDCLSRMVEFNKLHWRGVSGMSGKQLIWCNIHEELKKSKQYADHIINWRDIK